MYIRKAVDTQVGAVRSVEPDISINATRDMESAIHEPTMLECLDKLSSFCKSHYVAGVPYCAQCELHIDNPSAPCALHHYSPADWANIASYLRQEARYTKA